MTANEYRASIYVLASYDRGMAGPVNVTANIINDQIRKGAHASRIVLNGTHLHRPEIFFSFNNVLYINQTLGTIVFQCQTINCCCGHIIVTSCCS